MSEIAQSSVMGIAMGRISLLRLEAGIYLFYFLLCIFLIVATAQSGSGVYLASYPVDTGELWVSVLRS